MSIRPFLSLFVGCFLIGSQHLIQAATYTGVITNYRPTFIPVQDQQGQLRIIIRLFKQDNRLYALLVDPYNLAISRSDFSTLRLRKGAQGNLSSYFTWGEIENTPYMHLVRHCTSPPYPLQNDGIKHAVGPTTGFFLTVDMCPSSKEFEKDFFETLINLKHGSAPFEVGISMTGLWMLGHPDEFAWLCAQNDQGNLHITWINHTFRHLYYKDLPLEKNFMRFSPIDLQGPAHSSFIQASLQEEVLLTEQLLLEHGQLPSVFFRFPGLVSDEALLHELGNLGLIPLGSDAWLAKGEEPQPGSIILVHGNGNEKPGINKIMEWLRKRNVQWLPLAHLGSKIAG